MCGIVGISSTGRIGERDRAAVRRMADTIVHRGPNDEGFYDGDGVVLGMRRLSIIDIEGAPQPIFNETRDVVVVCNGEIYNFRELRQSLRQKGHVFSTDGDVEVIVHLYEEYGDAFVEHLDGMFAIALWDTRRERLILVRDHLGIKPLYYADQKGGIAFASEAKALFELDGFHAGVSQTGLRDYLGIGYCVAPHSIFDGVMKLPPASMLILESGEYRVRRYWTLPDKVEEGVTDEEWADRIHAALGAAVRAQMVSDVPLGAFLSGGVDSSAIVAFMAQNSERPIKTYSIGYAGSGTAAYYNELSYAKVVADQFATDHHEIEVDPDVVSMLPKLIWHLEEPVSDSALATTYLVSEMAAKTVTVILSGVGGDELFAGYNRYLGGHYRDLYHKIPSWIRNSVLTQIAGRLPSGRQNRWLDLSRYARSFIMSADLPWDERYKPTGWSKVFYKQPVTQRDVARRAGPAGRSRQDHGRAGRGRRASAPHARRLRNADGRRPAAANRQDDHGELARVQGAVPESRSHRTGGPDSRSPEMPGITAQVPAQEGPRAGAAGWHPEPQEARIRCAGRCLVQEQPAAAAQRTAERQHGRREGRVIARGRGGGLPRA